MSTKLASSGQPGPQEKVILKESGATRIRSAPHASLIKDILPYFMASYTFVVSHVAY